MEDPFLILKLNFKIGLKQKKGDRWITDPLGKARLLTVKLV
jgi:hypothetical protein